MSSPNKVSVADLTKRLQCVMDLLDDALKAGLISQTHHEEEKRKFFDEEMQRMQKEEMEKSKASSQSFLPEEIAREPFLKEILNQQDLWKRHEAAIAEDRQAWEKRVRDVFIEKSIAGELSPLLVLIGQYLIFSTDFEAGRRRLLEILFLQPADQRIKIHNWLILASAPKGTNITFGRKVGELSFPLFPFGNSDLEQLNSMILDEPGNLHGGNGVSKNISSLYLQDS